MTPILGHMLLVGAISVDYFARSVQGRYSALLSTICTVILLIAGVLFVRLPGAFFFLPEKAVELPDKPPVGLRVLAWLFVLATPVVWLLLAVHSLPYVIQAELMRRLFGSYLLFLYLAGAILVWPWLSGRSEK
jgi:formate hydrogenlyase subunit 3/multisubunit Na+/H+ antiporter MnhD subunit